MASGYTRMLREISQEVCNKYQNGEKDALKRVLRRHNLAVIQTMFLDDFLHLQKFKQLLIVKNRMLPSMISSPPALSDPEELKNIQEIAIRLNNLLNTEVDELIEKIKSLSSYQYVTEKMGWNVQKSDEEIKQALTEIKDENGENKENKEDDKVSKTTGDNEDKDKENSSLNGEKEDIIKEEDSDDIEVV